MVANEVALVRSFPNDPVVRRIFEEKDDWVLLCPEEEFRLWEEEGIKPQTVRCPKSRVYNYDPELYSKLKQAAYVLEDENLLETLWNQAESYYGTAKKNRSRAKYGA